MNNRKPPEHVIAAGATTVSDSGLSEEPESPPQRKRRKIALACGPCRERKIRCDGTKPVCLTCEKRRTKDKCVYEEATGTLKTQKYVASLESRIKELEKLRMIPTKPRLIPASTLSSNHVSAAGASSAHASPHTVSSQKSQSTRGFETNLITAEYGPANSPDDDNASDAFNTVPSTEDDSKHYFGGSSSIAFVRALRQALIQGNQSSSLHYVENHSHVDEPTRNQQAVVESNTSSFSLPSRRSADSYMRCFWKNTHPIYPILHKPTFMAVYEELWAPGTEVYSQSQRFPYEDPIFQATFNIVFAIGCQFSELVPAECQSNVADQFYQQSRKLLAFDALDSASLPLVQLLLLTGVYLQSSNHGNRCWNVVCLAIRNAQSLGLHVENPKSTSTNQIRRETRRRVWHVCMMLDTLLASTFGRPKMINASTNVPLPLCIDDDYLLANGEGSQPNGQESYLGLFVSSLKLFDIISGHLSALYYQQDICVSDQSDTTPWWSQDRTDRVLRLNEELEKFLEECPPHLKFKAHQSGVQYVRDPHWHTIQSNVLRCRFLYIRTALLGHFLLSTLQHRYHPQLSLMRGEKASLGQAVALRVCILCIETVHTLVAAMHSNLHVVFRSPGCHIHYAFSCGLILVAASMCAFPEPECNELSIQTSWMKCMEIISHNKPQVPSVSHAIQVLESLRLGVVSDKSSGLNTESRPLQSNFTPGLDSVTGELAQEVEGNMDWLNDNWFAEQISDLNWLENLEG